MFRVSRLVILAAIVHMLPVTVTGVEVTQQQKHRAQSIKTNIQDPSGNSLIGAGVFDLIKLEATRDKKTALAQIGYKVLRLKISGSVSSEKEPATLVTLDGLSNATKFSVALSRWRWKPKPDLAKTRDARLRYYRAELTDAIRKEYDQKIEKAASNKQSKIRNLSDDDPTAQDTLKKAQKDFSTRVDSLTGERDAVLDSVASDDHDALLTRMKKKNLKPSMSVNDLRKHGKDKWADELEAAWESGTPIWYTVEITIGRESFAHAIIDSTSFTAKKESKEPYSLEIGLGVLAVGNAFIAISYKREEAYKAGAKEELFVPNDVNANVLVRKSLAIAPPKLRTSHLASLELRRFFGEHLAVNPKITYRFDDEVTEGKLPLFFLVDKKGDGLNGGVEVAWRSDTGDVGVTVFVSQKFRLLPSD